MPESNLSFEGLAGWPAIMQQYRICGNYGELSTDEMRTQWRKKPLGRRHSFCRERQRNYDSSGLCGSVAGFSSG